MKIKLTRIKDGKVSLECSDETAESLIDGAAFAFGIGSSISELKNNESLLIEISIKCSVGPYLDHELALPRRFQNKVETNEKSNNLP